MKIEKTFVVLAIIGVIFKLLDWPGSGIFMIISLTFLSMLYFPGAFYFFADKSMKRQNTPLSIVAGLVLSITTIGMLFRFMYWPGGAPILFIGLVGIPFVLGGILFLKSKAPEELATYYRNMVTRTSVLLILASVFYFTPTETLVKVQYWHDQELARLKALHYLNPNNEAYRRQHDEYVSKKYNTQMEEDYLQNDKVK